MSNKTTLTDLYQLTMNAAYEDNAKTGQATFDLFIRKLPKDWGYFIACGIEDAIDYATNIRFAEEDIEELRARTCLPEEFLQSLKDFKFEGEIYAVKEGTVISENTPLLRVTSTLSQAQFLESALLNIINHQTLIASKASRIVNAARGRPIVEFGLRRAQGEDAAMLGARASYIAGFSATSNVKAGIEYDIPIAGTHAHSFVMSFKDELTAFRAYVKRFPKDATLLIDTYNIEQGARNAATVAHELKLIGSNLRSVRIDSDPLDENSDLVRRILDQAGLQDVGVFATNDLNEYKIEALQEKPISGYGVGTENITGKPISAIPGVYKIVEDEEGSKIKLSLNKKTYPGKKQVYRICDTDGHFSHDVLALDSETIPSGIPLLEKVVEHGVRVSPRRSIPEIREYALHQVSLLRDGTRQINSAIKYETIPSAGLVELTESLSRKFGGQ